MRQAIIPLTREPDGRNPISMKIHEYQARELLTQSGVAFLPSQVARTGR